MVIEHGVVVLLALIVVILWRYVARKKQPQILGKIVLVQEPDGDREVFLRIPQNKLDSGLKDGAVVSFLVVNEDYDEFINSQE